MAITTQVEVDLASVEVTDEYRVELTQLRKVLDYSPDQARLLAQDLVEAAWKAEQLLISDTARHGQVAAATVPPTIDGTAVL